MEITKKKDVNIQVVRVVSMLLIILTHFVREINGIEFLAQVTNSAIYTFLLISGYLLAKRKIENPVKWFLHRMCKIITPVYIYMIFLLAMRFIMFGELSIKIVLINLFNLQGFFGNVNGATHLWFVTTIMLCYMVTPLLQKIAKSEKNVISLFFLILVIVQLITTFQISQNIGQNLFYILVYSMAYLFSGKDVRHISNKKLFIVSIVALLSLIFRFVSRAFLDDSLVYNVLIVSFSQAVLGMYIFVFLDRFNFDKMNTKIKAVVKNLDKISFEMFIVHYAFIKGPFFIFGLTSSIVIDSILTIIATYISALLLHYISNRIKKLTPNF